MLSCLEDRTTPINLNTLAKAASPDYQLCHRLDKETSGVLVVAKNPEAYRHFALQLEKRQVKKVYHAVLNGLHRFDNFEADEPLMTASNKSRVDVRAGKPSLTLVHTLEVYKKHTFVKCFPVSGRLHQIRIHMAHHQAPLAGDPLYGGAPPYLSELKKNFKFKKWEEEKPMIGRVALHAYQIAFTECDGRPVEASAEYPKDFSVLLKLLAKYK